MRQFIVKSKLTLAFYVSVLLLTMNFVIVKVVFGTVMMKFMINNRTNAWKTYVNFLIRTTPYKCPAHTITSLLTPRSLIKNSHLPDNGNDIFGPY